MSAHKSQINLLQHLIVDNFAGGGGASTGIELATGRPVDIAVNHDPDAILMHKTNHPYTEHYQASVWDIKPKKVCKGRPVGLAWFSPDCKHFSKAKGSKPVDKNIRGLSWVVLRWGLDVPPNVIIMENVEEIQTWGPVRTRDDGKQYPDPDKKGKTFQGFIGMLTTGIAENHPALAEACEFLKIAIDSIEARQLIKGLGYTVEWRELVAADYGVPTTRKRFFLIARRDGKPIVWPEPSHAPANSAAVQAGKKKPWRSAAEIIDWSLPTPSIFDSKANIKEKYGLNAVRPLADNTLRRIIRGVDRFVIQTASPFIVPIGYGEAHNQLPRVHDINEPLPTAVGRNKDSVVTPVYAPLTMHNNENATGTDIKNPINTVTSSGAGGHQMLISATLTAIGQTGGGNRNRKLTDPTHTQVSKAEECIIAPTLIQYHTEQNSDYHRGQQITKPMMTIDGANRYAVAAPTMLKYYGNDAHGQDIQSPLHTITAKDREGLIMAHMVKMKGDEIGGPIASPVPTITAGGRHHGVVATRVVRFEEGVDLRHWPKIRALLNQYCGYNQAEDEIILFNVSGVWYFMVDIGLRMLAPRELYSANGFPCDYIIDRDYTGKEYGKTKQVARCGNAVPPQLATVLVQANLPEWCAEDIHTMAELERLVAI